MDVGIIAKLRLHALLTPIEHTHVRNIQRDIGVTAHKFTGYLEMLFKGHGKLERLNRFQNGLKIWRVHLTTHAIHIDGVAETQSAIVSWGEPAVPFDAVILVEVVRDGKAVIWALPA